MTPNRKVEIVGRRLELSDGLKMKVNEMVDKLYEHDSGISFVRVELSLERHANSHHDEFIAKGHIDDRKDHFNASASSDDLYKSIADLSVKLDRLIRRRSRKRVTRRRKLSPVELVADLPKAASLDSL